MRDLFERGEGKNTPDPTKSARQAARPVLRNRFFKEVATAQVPEGFAVTLDGRPVRTPAGRTLAAPRPQISDALLAEWDAQTRLIDPAQMPMTRLANAIIDALAERQDEAATDIIKYLGSDLLFYRADGPPGLVAKQTATWDPIVRWAADDLGARFVLAEGIVHAAQPEPAMAAARAAIPADGWIVGALHSITTLTGSALLALALLRKFADADAIWRAAHVDEDWNFEKWGFDDEALERRKAREAEYRVAALVLMSM
jgi:chaperone required for assembly of F1-ATPase